MVENPHHAQNGPAPTLADLSALQLTLVGGLFSCLHLRTLNKILGNSVDFYVPLSGSPTGSRIHGRSCRLRSTRPVSTIGPDTRESPTYLHRGRHALTRDVSPIQHGLGSLSLARIVFGHIYGKICRHWRQAQDFIPVRNSPYLCGNGPDARGLVECPTLSAVSAV